MLLGLLKIILLFFVPLYAVIMSLRNWFFDIGIFKAKKIDAKVISIGNITLGGSGKTPLVIYILNLLKSVEIKAGVLSRGYGRKTKGYLLVSDGENILQTVENCGDEIYHTVLECKVPAAVCENRVEGANKLLKDANIDYLVLDDAFQHRWIYRDLNLVIFEQQFLKENKFLQHSLLPAGFLRESFKSLERADAIIINRKFSLSEEIPSDYRKFLENKLIFQAYYKAVTFADVRKNENYHIEDFRGQKSLIISGIANPFSFLTALKNLNIDCTNQLIFKDHQNYTLEEVQKIRKLFYSTNSYSVITTEKDAVKLTNFSKELDDIDIYYLKIQMCFDNEKEFNDFVLKK